MNDGVTDAGFSIAIPCSLTEGRDVPIYPLLIGHGLFQTGDELVSLFGYFDTQADHDYIAGGTNWRGLSGQDDVLYIGGQVIGLFESKLNNFKALPDRLKQGMVNTLVLTRMMKEGHFNSHPAFQLDVEGEEEPVPAFPGPESEMYYFGISLGGINGTWLASLTPDIEKFNVDVPGMNFAMLLQRATPFKQFETLLAPIGLRDPMVTLVGLTLIQELWVEGEPGGYVHRLARQIERGRKKVLLTEAWPRWTPACPATPR